MWNEFRGDGGETAQLPLWTFSKIKEAESGLTRDCGYHLLFCYFVEFLNELQP